MTEEQINDLKAKMFSIASKEYTWKVISQQYKNIIV